MIKKLLKPSNLPMLLTAPYFILCLLFLVFPLTAVVISGFGHGLGSMRAVLTKPIYVKSLLNSLTLSTMVTIEASVLGATLALFWVKRIIKDNWFLSILNFAANNGGITLAFAIIATLGSSGFLTLLLKAFGINLYPGFNIVSLTGLNLAYLCFLVPYMALLFMPAAGCLKKEWWESAQILGSNKLRYILKVAGPVLLPSFLSSACLVFLTSLGTYATAYAISGNNVDLITIHIGALIQTSILKMTDAYTLSFLLFIIMLIFIFIYQNVNLKAGRWLR